MIKKIKIENFRSIRNQEIELRNYTILIGDNGSGKTSVIEAINFALSPSYLSGRIKHTDFYNGEDNPIHIEIEFDKSSNAKLPDGYVKQDISYDKVLLKIKFNLYRQHAPAYNLIYLL